jgi:branched-chain amino acid transport system ATP-binding protein
MTVASTHEEFALALRNVTAGYGEHTVLRDVSLVVPRGSVVALLGPNGAGKTSLLRVASGQLAVSGGDVEFNGSSANEKSTYQMAREGLCHIPEGRGVFPSLSVRENLQLFAKKDEKKQAVDLAIAAFPPLKPKLNQIAGSLSGGEQQMVAIVRAYISHPSLVLVDEASMGLAPLIIDGLFEFLANIIEGGTSLLIVEQYVHRALALASQVYLLNKGRIVYGGEAASLKSDEVFDSYFAV